MSDEVGRRVRAKTSNLVLRVVRSYRKAGGSTIILVQTSVSSPGHCRHPEEVTLRGGTLGTVGDGEQLP